MTDTKPTPDTVPAAVKAPANEEKLAKATDRADRLRSTADRVESLPWLIRKLRGRYECESTSRNVPSKD